MSRGKTSSFPKEKKSLFKVEESTVELQFYKLKSLLWQSNNLSIYNVMTQYLLRSKINII